MISESKAASDTKLHSYNSSPSSFIPLKLISSINSDQIHVYRSRNKILSTKIFHDKSSDHLTRSINENKNFIQTHFPIANIPSSNLKISSFQDYMISNKTSLSPTVPKQAGTFIHRLVNKFLSLTNTNPKKTNRNRIKQKQRNIILSDDRCTTMKKRKRQCLKSITKKKYINRKCQTYENYLSKLPKDSLECLTSLIHNSNATTTFKTPPILIRKSSISLSFEKFRTLNPSQCQTIASAVQLIFNTLISNNQSN